MSQAQMIAAKKRARIQRHGVQLLKALKLLLPHPIFGTHDPTAEQEYWESELVQGRGCAKDVLYALSVIRKAEGK